MEIWEDYPSLFHYTSEEGVFGILQSQVLHATHYRYLNDTMELLLMKPIMTDMLIPHVQDFYSRVMKSAEGAKAVAADGGAEKLVERVCNTIVESIYKVTLGEGHPHAHFRPHIVSFCSHAPDSYEWQHGLLSQWRSYGGASGYALVFDTKALWEMAKDEHAGHQYDPLLQLCDVVYCGAAAEEIEAEFKDLRGEIDKSAPKFLPWEDPDLSELCRQVPASLPRVKHQGFREEGEVRLILSPADPSLQEKQKAASGERDDRLVKDVSFKNSFTPYIKLFEGANADLPIQRILVGPNREKELRCQRLREYLKVTGRAIPVDCSDTPFV